MDRPVSGKKQRFRHIFAEGGVRVDNVRPQLKTCEGSSLAVSAEGLVAVPWTGGGGVGIFNLSSRRLPHEVPILLHQGGVLDLEFSSDGNILLTGGDDGAVKLWRTDANESEISTTPLTTLAGVHARKVTSVRPNPVAGGVAVSASFDGSLALWDLEIPNIPILAGKGCMDVFATQVAWNFLGSLLLINRSDKGVKLLDPRLGGLSRMDVGVSKCHDGVKGSRAAWLCGGGLSDDNYFVTCGFSADAKREFAIWDRRRLANSVERQILDDNAGLITPHFDEYSGLTFLAGRGDGNVRIYEFKEGSLNYITDYRSQAAQKGLAFFPKRSVATDKNEILKCVKLEVNAVSSLSFAVPRKSDLFQGDLYPPCASGLNGITSKAWLGGMNGELKLLSLGKDGQHKTEAPGIIIQKAPVLKENDDGVILELKSRIEQLENENRQLSAALIEEKQSNKHLRSQLNMQA